MTHLLTRFPQSQVRSFIAKLEERVHIKNSVWNEMEPMTWEMVMEMHRDGFTIGSHTQSHTLLPYESPETIARELRESRRILERRLKSSVQHFAYPDGRFNPAVVRAVRDAGYGFAYTICRSGDSECPHLTIPRKVLWERSCINMLGRFSSSIMKCQSDWLFDSDTDCEHDHVKIRKYRGVSSGAIR
jgi:hypothetical protein